MSAWATHADAQRQRRAVRPARQAFAAQGLAHAVGRQAGVVCGHLCQQGEFVAAQARSLVVGPAVAIQHLRQQHQSLVASGVAVAVVHGLLMVHVDHQQRQCRPLVQALRLVADVARQGLVEAAPVEQPGQCVAT